MVQSITRETYIIIELKMRLINFMILKIEKIRLKEISINKEKELKKMIKYETNKIRWMRMIYYII